MLSSAYSRPIFYYSMTLWLILIMKTECTRLSFYLNSTVELLLHDHWRDLAKEVVLEECPLKRGWSRCKLIIFWIDKMILLLPPLTINNRHRDFSLRHTEGGGVHLHKLLTDTLYRSSLHQRFHSSNKKKAPSSLALPPQTIKWSPYRSFRLNFCTFLVVAFALHRDSSYRV